MRASSGLECSLALAAVLLAAPLRAQVADADGVDWSAAVGVVRDDNIFRLADGVDPQPLLGASDTADIYRTASLGVHLDIPVSAQRFEGQATYTDHGFERFGHLDHHGYTARAAWLWRAGRRFDGRLGYAMERSLASLANLQSGMQSSGPNFLKIRELVFDAGHGLGARWQLRGAFARLEQDNSSAEFRPSDLRRNRYELTLGYASGRGNHLGLVARRDDARLPNAQLIAGMPVDNSYRQWRIGAALDWMPSGKSRFDLWTGRVAREYRQQPQRDHAEWAYNLAWEWRPTGKLMLTVAAQRDLGEHEQVNVGFVTIQGIAVRPAMQLGARTRLALNFQRDLRRYGGDLAVDPTGSAAGPRERVRVMGLDLSWQATRVLNMALALRREMRDATQAVPDYSASIVGLEIRAVL